VLHLEEQVWSCNIPLVGSPEIGEPACAWAEIGGTTPAALRDCETTPQSRRVEISNINYETESICYLINLMRVASDPLFYRVKIGAVGNRMKAALVRLGRGGGATPAGR